MSNKPTYEELEQRVKESERRVKELEQDTVKHKQAEVVLKESQERMELALKGSGLGMWNWDLENDSIVFNKKSEELLEHSPKDIEEWFSRIHLDDLERVKAYDKAIIEGKNEILDYEHRVVLESGTIRWLHSRGQVVEWNKEGKSIRAAGTVYDITEHKKIKETLLESERNLKRAQQISKIGSWYYDWVNGTEIWSDECYKIFGIKKNDSQDNIVSISLILNETYANPEESSRLFRSLAEKNEKFHYEYTTIPINGEIKSICSYCEVERDKAGNIIKVFGTDNDITEQKKSEKTLRESEERYRTLFERSNDAIFLINKRKGKYIDANQAAEKLTGFSLAEIKAKSTKDLTPEGAESRLGAVAALETSKKIGEVKYLRADGTVRDAILTVVPLIGNQIMGIANDITDRKRAEEALVKSHDELESQVKSRTAELEKINNALTVLLIRRDKDKIELEEKILSNVKELIIPILKKLKKSQLDDKQISLLTLQRCLS